MKYSDIFNKYTIDGIEFNNILKKIELPKDKSISLYTKHYVQHDMPWTSLSYKIYGDISYYWLLILANNEKQLDPFYARASEELDIISPTYLNVVINSIEESI